jgi:hypothetical protein
MDTYEINMRKKLQVTLRPFEQAQFDILRGQENMGRMR